MRATSRASTGGTSVMEKLNKGESVDVPLISVPVVGLRQLKFDSVCSLPTLAYAKVSIDTIV